MDVITMKKAVSFILVCVIITCLFVGCSKDAATPLQFTKEGVTKIVIVTPENKNALITESDKISSFLLTLENAKCVSDTSLTHSVGNEQYRFTTYTKDNNVINTFSIYSAEYIQLGETLYKGNLADLIASIQSNFNQAIEKLETLSPIFTTETTDIIEIAFHNEIENTFKVVTLQEDVEKIMNPLKALKISDTPTEGNVMETYVFYIRLKDTAEYQSPIQISKHDTGSSCQVDGKTVVVSNYNWSVLYEKLNYNTMPIHQ